MLLAQIHSGADLLAACSDSDTSACDEFIHQTVQATAGAQCFLGAPSSDVRAAVLQALQATDAKLSGSAADIVGDVLSGECNAAE